MRKLLVVLALTGVLLAIPAVALAHTAPTPFPASSQAVCQNTYQGTWNSTSGTPPTTTCTVTSQSFGTVPASHPTQAWEVDVTTTDTITYTKTGGSETHQHSSSQVVTECRNHQGISIPLPNPNCAPG